MSFREALCRVEAVRECAMSAVVYCRSSGALIDHDARLKALGCTLNLCHSEAELLDLLETGMRFRFLIFDGFDFYRAGLRLHPARRDKQCALGQLLFKVIGKLCGIFESVAVRKML